MQNIVATETNRRKLSIVTKQPKAVTQRDPSILWQGRVAFLVPSVCEFDDMGGECLIVPVGERLEMHVTHTAIVPELHEEDAKDVMVNGILTVRRGMPYEVTSITLQLDDLRPSRLEFRLGTKEDRKGSFWSKRVPGTVWMYIVPAIPLQAQSRIAA